MKRLCNYAIISFHVQMEFLDLILLGQHLGHGPGHVANHGVLANMVATILPHWNAWKNLSTLIITYSQPKYESNSNRKKNHLIMFPKSIPFYYFTTTRFYILMLCYGCLKKKITGLSAFLIHVENYRMMKAPVWDTIFFFSLDKCMYSVRYRAQ